MSTPRHLLNPALAGRPIATLVIGLGGTGGPLASNLYYLDAALRTQGHPGLHVTLMDGDTVSQTNVVRQPFAPNEIGLNKAIVVAHRMNAFRGTQWQALPRYFTEKDNFVQTDFVITCVDNREARRLVHTAATAPNSRVTYWLDLGNYASGGQWVLGEPKNLQNKGKRGRLRTSAELWPEIIKPEPTDDDLPSCSAAEALNRQEPLVNQTLADHAVAMLAMLFRHGETKYQGQFWNLKAGRAEPIPVGQKPARRRKARAVAAAHPTA
jgi:PRTRC genetic system ThiF family protein